MVPGRFKSPRIVPCLSPFLALQIRSLSVPANIPQRGQSIPYHILQRALMTLYYCAITLPYFTAHPPKMLPLSVPSNIPQHGVVIIQYYILQNARQRCHLTPRNSLAPLQISRNPLFHPYRPTERATIFPYLTSDTAEGVTPNAFLNA